MIVVLQRRKRRPGRRRSKHRAGRQGAAGGEGGVGVAPRLFRLLSPPGQAQGLWFCAVQWGAKHLLGKSLGVGRAGGWDTTSTQGGGGDTRFFLTAPWALELKNPENERHPGCVLVHNFPLHLHSFPGPPLARPEQ